MIDSIKKQKQQKSVEQNVDLCLKTIQIVCLIIKSY